MTEDGELLQRYADEGTESAFTEIVQRHVSLVYFAAKRRLGGDGHLAQDVTQMVFTELARRAQNLAQHPSLAGWLYLTARNHAAKLVRSEVRRRAREAEAESITIMRNAPECELDWHRIAPLLERALCQLSTKDREAVLLRMWENRDFRDIARVQGTTEGAARMRMARSLDKLRAGLRRAGIPSTATAIEQALQTQAMAACPPALSAHVAAAAITAATAHVSGAGWSIFMSSTSTKVIGTAAIAIILLALGFSDSRTADRLEARVSQEARTVEALRQIMAPQTAQESVKSKPLGAIPNPAKPVSLRAGANFNLGEIPSGPSRASLQMTSYGAVSWEGTRVTLERFLANITQYRKAHPEEDAQLVIDANGVPASQLSYLFDQAARAGFRNVWFDPSSRSPLSGPPPPGSEALPWAALIERVRP